MEWDDSFDPNDAEISGTSTSTGGAGHTDSSIWNDMTVLAGSGGVEHDDFAVSVLAGLGATPPAGGIATAQVATPLACAVPVGTAETPLGSIVFLPSPEPSASDGPIAKLPGSHAVASTFWKDTSSSDASLRLRSSPGLRCYSEV